MSVIDIGQHRKNRADERIDVLTGQHDALLSLRAGRPEIRDYMESGARALMTEIAPGSLSAIERHALALRVASLGGAAPIADAHRAELDWFGLDAATITAIETGNPAPALTPRLQALLAHATLLTVSPQDAAPPHIADLRAAGLTTREIVAGLQLIAFLAFETRLLASLQHLGPPQQGEA